MGRRKLSEHELRRHQVNISLRDDERAELLRRADLARMPVHDYVRRRALSDRLRVVPPRRLGVEEFREVARLSSNVNQIARALNSGRGAVGPETARELERLRELLEQLMPQKRD
jgi:hypothetical protein